MTHEEFAHMCLKIKSGDTSIEIPCCANCEHYKKSLDYSKTNLYDLAFNHENNYIYRYECRHPALESDDPFVATWIETTPEDFCSRFEPRKENEDAKLGN